MKSLLAFLTLLLLLFQTQSQKTKEGQEMINTCTNALMQNIPPMWCWKSVKDKSVDPRYCPSGYTRTNNVCLKQCNTGYSLKGGVCYKGGDNKSKDKYVPEKITNGDSRIICPKNTYKEGAKCYANCNVIGMENCGKSACSIDTSACTNTIIEMIKDVIQGVIEFIAFCTSLGTSSGVKAAKTGLNKGLNLVSKKGIETALKGIKKAFANKFKETIKSKAKQAAKNLFDTFKKYSQSEVNKICDEVYNNIERDIKKKSSVPTKEELLKAIDVFDISNIVTSCKSKDAYECTRACLNTAKDFDPTGLLTIATTFMKPKCVVPEPVFSNFIYYDDFFSNVNGCIRVYSNYNFNGEFNDICGDASLLQNIKSIRANLINNYLLFTQYNFEGKRFLLGKIGEIDNIEDFIDNGERIKSVKKINDYCAYIFINGKLNEVCEDIESIDLKEGIIEIYSDNVIVTVYSEDKFKGQSLRLSQIASGSKLNSIKSIKITPQYDSLGFLCGHEANTKEIIRLNDGDIECFSIDGINCLILPQSKSECVEYINIHSNNMSPISCSLDIPRLINLDSFKMPDWCINGRKYFKDSFEFIE